jgi:hypothetical protein
MISGSSRRLIERGAAEGSGRPNKNTARRWPYFLFRYGSRSPPVTSASVPGPDVISPRASMEGARSVVPAASAERPAMESGAAPACNFDDV